jgi:hypothetical protein
MTFMTTLFLAVLVYIITIIVLNEAAFSRYQKAYEDRTNSYPNKLSGTEKLIVTHPVMSFPPFVESEGSLPCSQQPALMPLQHFLTT